MSGLRIYNVHPRLAGPVQDWSGMESGQSWLLDHAQDLGFNAIWFNPLTVTSNVSFTNDEGKECTGSLYAVRDHFAMDPEFRGGASNEQGEEHLRHFLQLAKDEGVVTMADMVFNHFAADHPLVLKETAELRAITGKLEQGGKKWELIRAENGIPYGITWTGEDGKRKEYQYKFARNEQLNVLNFDDVEGYDTAQINFDSPAAYDFFIKGKDSKKGYWKQVLDYNADLGFTGFRCDIAFKVPAHWWQDLIKYAHERNPDAVFLAETLGGKEKNDRLAGARLTGVAGQASIPAFTLGMHSVPWWDGKSDWFKWESEQLCRIAQFGGAGCPDNHDTELTLAQTFMKALSERKEPLSEEKRLCAVSDICVRDYAIAALLCNSVYMQMGYEYCRDQINVFRGDAVDGDWDRLVKERISPDHPLNLTARIKAINDFKEKLDLNNTLVRIENINPGYREGLTKIECTLQDAVSPSQIKGKMVLFVNQTPENGGVTIEQDEIWPDESGRPGPKRLVLGDEDKTKAGRYRINDIAAYYTPFCQPLAVLPVLKAGAPSPL